MTVFVGRKLDELAQSVGGRPSGSSSTRLSIPEEGQNVERSRVTNVDLAGRESGSGVDRT